MSEGEMEAAYARIIQLAAAAELPEVEHSTSYGNPALKVGGKGFATVKDGTTLVLRCPLEQKDLLMEMSPDIYFQTDHYRGWPYVLVRLDVVGDEELQLRLGDAYEHRAPKRLAAEVHARRQA